MKIFDREVYEQQRINIERLAKEKPKNWFYKSQMSKPANQRTGFAPVNGICHICHSDITKGNKAITLEKLGDYIILDCPYCNISYCE